MAICTIRYDINGVDYYWLGGKGKGGMWHFALAWRSVVSGLREDSCFMIARVYFKGQIPYHDFLLCNNLSALAILSINDLLLLDLFRPFSSSFLSKQIAKWKTSPPSPFTSPSDKLRF